MKILLLFFNNIELEWLNCSQKIDITEYHDKIILVDFWTYCCINCLHVIPVLKRIQSEFPQVVLFGCHSSKFVNERSKENILSALKRHLISHPIACDSNLDIWNNLGIICWPTILAINPDGLIIGEFIGEVNCNYLKTFIEISRKFYEKKLNSQIIRFDQKQSFIKNLNKNLFFPTKLTFNEQENLLFISDSGNNRILGFDVKQKIVKLEISSTKCFESSEFIECCLNWPQGIAYDHELKTLFIADTFNNAIVLANLDKKEAKILCGVGIKNSIGLYDLKGGKKGMEQEISSPWDLKLMKKDNSKILLIACAGTHQIWLYSFQNELIDHHLKNLLWWKNMNIEWGTLVCVAGNGKERNKNNVYPLQASFAQPSGLCFDTDLKCYIADAESSTIRVINLVDGSVKGFVGGNNLDPDNLFAYGDKDGIGYEAKLQHPLDICFVQNHLIVADAFNNCIKLIDVKSKFCRKICISGSGLNEPNGVCIDENNGYLWVADTNNHSIKFAKINRILEEKEIVFTNSLLEISMDSLDSVVEKVKKMDILQQKYIQIKFNFKLNTSAENFWRVKVNDMILNGLFDKNSLTHQIFLGKIDKIESLEIQINVVICQTSENDSVCRMLNNTFILESDDLIFINKNGYYSINF